MDIDLTKYETAYFSTQVTNRRITRLGHRVGEFLIVSYADERRRERVRFRIYRSIDGLECIKTTFLKLRDAIKFAEWLRSKYEYYFFIWTEYPHAELFRWTYMTIPNGEKYWKALQKIEKMRDTTWEDVQRILD